MDMPSVIAGNGLGFDAGVLLYNKHSSFGLSVSHVGFISWGDVQEAHMRIRRDDLSLDDMITGNPDSLFDSANGGYLSGEGDSLKKRSNYSTTLPRGPQRVLFLSVRLFPKGRPRLALPTTSSPISARSSILPAVRGPPLPRRSAWA